MGLWQALAARLRPSGADAHGDAGGETLGRSAIRPRSARKEAARAAQGTRVATTHQIRATTAPAPAAAAPREKEDPPQSSRTLWSQRLRQHLEAKFAGKAGVVQRQRALVERLKELAQRQGAAAPRRVGRTSWRAPVSVRPRRHRAARPRRASTTSTAGEKSSSDKRARAPPRTSRSSCSATRSTASPTAGYTSRRGLVRSDRSLHLRLHPRLQRPPTRDVEQRRTPARQRPGAVELTREGAELDLAAVGIASQENPVHLAAVGFP